MRFWPEKRCRITGNALADVAGLSVHATAMTHVPFHVTRAGREFYERHVPELLRQLARLNENLEALARAVRAEVDHDGPEPDGARHDRED